MNSNPHWANKRENGSYLAIKMLLTVYRFGGKWLILICLIPVLAYFFIKDKVARQASCHYLQRLHQHQATASPFKRSPGYWLAYRHFWQFALAALDKIDAWVGNISPTHVFYSGSTSFQDIVATQKGAVFIASHLGNIEACRALVRSKYPVKINVLAHTKHTAAFNRILKDHNSAVDLNLIEVTELSPMVSIMLSECVERGEIVVIVGDRISTQAPERAIWADFLGQSAPFPIGPWVLASLMHCPVYLMFCMKHNSGYNLIFEHVADEVVLKRNQRDAILTQLIQDYAANLEQVACRYPLQWFNFYDFWQLPSRNNHEEQPGDNSSI